MLKTFLNILSFHQGYITITVKIIWVGMEHSLISDLIPFSIVAIQGYDHIQVHVP